MSDMASYVAGARREEILSNPGFGTAFTDHMVRASWNDQSGWTAPSVLPMTAYVLHPGAAVLHYAQEIFEGLKAYRQPDQHIALFRPQLNAERFAMSARRLALPVLPPDSFVSSVVDLVRADSEWVPQNTSDSSLYLRPYMFASEAFLGVRPANLVEFGVIASPAGSYFTHGDVGISLWLDGQYRRASAGGTGSAKCGGNYAASLLPQVRAREHHCDQVLYTTQVAGRECIDESGTMNIFFVTSDDQLVTPSLGTALAGVTRASILDLARDHGLEPSEREVPLDEFEEGLQGGTIVEVFASGTAAAVTPVVGIRSASRSLCVGNGSPGPWAQRLRLELLNVQYGRSEDTHAWMVTV